MDTFGAVIFSGKIGTIFTDSSVLQTPLTTNIGFMFCSHSHNGINSIADPGTHPALHIQAHSGTRVPADIGARFSANVGPYLLIAILITEMLLSEVLENAFIGSALWLKK